ncbi:hypothetical protein E4T66_02490 [Sinimarinibacterium sp. CAU 1509]|nr:hypothetical protein E4T66_02490 [Sinimarinibacterium sp. CAU 1509]
MVVRVHALGTDALRAMFAEHGLTLHTVADDEEIPGSYWGETEAGLVGSTLYVRDDTPVHSVLHEGCHWLCMDAARRQSVHTDANGDQDEEMAVCCLQALLADRIAGYSRAQLFIDMDAWGYGFVLGSAAAWFAQEGSESMVWLRNHGMIDAAQQLLGPRVG